MQIFLQGLPQVKLSSNKISLMQSQPVVHFPYHFFYYYSTFKAWLTSKQTVLLVVPGELLLKKILCKILPLFCEKMQNFCEVRRVKIMRKNMELKKINK